MFWIRAEAPPSNPPNCVCGQHHRPKRVCKPARKYNNIVVKPVTFRSTKYGIHRGRRKLADAKNGRWGRRSNVFFNANGNSKCSWNRVRLVSIVLYYNNKIRVRISMALALFPSLFKTKLHQLYKCTFYFPFFFLLLFRQFYKKFLCR